MALFLDVETIGFPDNKGLQYGEYPLYSALDKYNNARIVQISAMLCNDKFELVSQIDSIIKINGFNITNHHIHNITNEISEQTGVPFTVAATNLHELIKQSSHIFAHNSNFDMNVLKSELFRAGLTNIIDEINKKSIICTMKHTKNIVKICNNYGIKDPKLSELYTSVTRKPMIQQHNAKYDVIHLHEAIKKLYDDNKLNFTETIIMKY
jgi:DNA polymerase III epsilon subunit-like protein